MRHHKYISLCCGADMTVEGNVTMYYVCEKCGEPCNPIKTDKTKTNGISKI